MLPTMRPGWRRPASRCPPSAALTTSGQVPRCAKARFTKCVRLLSLICLGIIWSVERHACKMPACAHMGKSLIILKDDDRLGMLASPCSRAPCWHH